MLPQEGLNRIDRVIKETWIHKISKDYADWYMLKEDSLKCCMYYHLRSRLDDLLREYNLRIYPEFYFRDLAYRADLADAVTDVVATSAEIALAPLPEQEQFRRFECCFLRLV